MKILVTGAAGFIGFHVVNALLNRGIRVHGIDNLNDYYTVSLKQSRLEELNKHPNRHLFNFEKIDIAEQDELSHCFHRLQPTRVIHLAAQAGVRYSIDKPEVYTRSNLLGFGNILELCRQYSIEHLVYASSSSVYGGNTKLPFQESDPVYFPVSYYAATKKANELMAYSYSKLYQLPTTGLRFFTVYGPWGRPDMSPFLFADAIIHQRPIQVFNHGDMLRDFTYIDDIVEGVIRCQEKIPKADALGAPAKIFNIGNQKPEQLMDFIGLLENAFGRTALKEMKPMQKGDVKATYADTQALFAWVGYQPKTPLKEGVEKFAAWYQTYYSNSRLR